jgi:hypothetical protein
VPPPLSGEWPADQHRRTPEACRVSPLKVESPERGGTTPTATIALALSYRSMPAAAISGSIL